MNKKNKNCVKSLETAELLTLMIVILLKPLFHQIASLLNDTSSVLNECIGAFSQPQELKVLLDNQKDLTQLEDIGELNILKHGISSQHVGFCFFPPESVLFIHDSCSFQSLSSLTVAFCLPCVSLLWKEL